MSVHYHDDVVTLHHGDCLAVLRADENGYDFDLGYGTRRAIPDASIDAIVTDPPYGLSATDAGHVSEALSHWLAGDREFLPDTGAGFMGNAWDAFVPPVAVWDEAMRVLKPGGHLLAFAGSRTHDLMALGIRLAGFEVRDSIAWLYGSGFPKSRDVAQEIDKLDAADERLQRAREFQSWLREHLTAKRIDQLTGTNMGYHLTTHPTQPSVATADLFDQLRPHLPEIPERIEQLVADRTVESANYAARQVVGIHRNAITRGAAGVTASGEGKARTESNTVDARRWEGWGTALKPSFEPIVVARKPFRGTVAANVVEHGTGAINIDATRIAGESTKRNNRAELGYHGGNLAESYETGSDRGRWPTNVILDDTQASLLDEQAPDTGGSGRASGPTLRGATQTGAAYGARNGLPEDREPAFYGGEKGGASRFFPRFPMTAEDWAWEARVAQLPTFRYEAKAPSSQRPKAGEVQHPTVKPLDLMRWLVRLVTPPHGVVLEPFAGSGTTVEAALLEGFRCVAVEREPDYLPLIEQRINKPLQQSLFGDWEGNAA